MANKISIVHDKYKAARGWNAWLVVVPARLSPNGRRQYKRYRTKAEAEQAVATLQRLDKTLSIPSILAPGDTEALRLSESILEETGMTLPMAASTVAHACQALEGTGYDIPAAVNLVRHLHQHYGSVDNALKMITGSARAAASAPSLGAALEDMNKAKATLSPATARTRNQFFSTLFRRIPGLRETPLNHLSAQDIARILEEAFPTPPSYNAVARELSALYSHAIKREWIADNPVKRVDRKYVEEKEIRACTPEELISLFAACRTPRTEEKEAMADANMYEKRILTQDTTDLLPYVALGAFAGVRPEETLRLTWGDISPEDNVLSIRAKSSKTGGTRHITLRPVLRSWLEQCGLGSHPADQLVVPPVSLKWRLLALRRRAGYSDATPWQADCLRHSYATYSLKSGTPLHVLQLDMGHTTTRLILARYMNMKGITRQMAETWWQLTPETLASSWH